MRYGGTTNAALISFFVFALTHTEDKGISSLLYHSTIEITETQTLTTSNKLY
jgi:hypothetical protein